MMVLQHYALSRQIEILMIDGERLFGNEFCLPAGPLREPISRLSRIDFLVMTGESETEIINNFSDKKIYYMHFTAG